MVDVKTSKYKFGGGCPNGFDIKSPPTGIDAGFSRGCPAQSKSSDTLR
jgi:hypothetical protein